MLLAQLLGLYLLNDVLGTGPGLASVINGAGNHNWQLRKKFAVLLGHGIANHARAKLFQPFAYVRTHATLHRALALAKSGQAHAANPIGDLTMGKKRGSASMRASQARNCG